MSVLWDTQNAMKYRFLLHNLNHTILTVDITSVGLPTEPIADESEVRSLSGVRFRGWHEAERHFLGLGAKQESLRKVNESLRKTGVAILTII
jgi:hypothetical protein